MRRSEAMVSLCDSFRKKLVPLAAFFLASACAATGATAPLPLRDGSPVQTDALVYHLQRLRSEYRAYARATFINHTISTVYFARCSRESDTPMFGVRRTGADSTRTLFVDWAWACVGGVPTGQILPGDSVTVRVSLGSVDQPAMQPPLKPEDLVGLMRVDFLLCRKYVTDSDDCDKMPQSARTSNAFLVTY